MLSSVFLNLISETSATTEPARVQIPDPSESFLSKKPSRTPKVFLNETPTLEGCSFRVEWPKKLVRDFWMSSRTEFKLPAQSMTKPRHDVCLAALCDGIPHTDAKLGDWVGLEDGWDNKTPDFIIRLPNGLTLILEFKTLNVRWTVREAQVKESWLKARNKYQAAIERRAAKSKEEVLFIVMVCCRDVVYSNCSPLASVFVRERMNLTFPIGEGLRQLIGPQMDPDDYEGVKEGIKFAEMCGRVAQDTKLPVLGEGCDKIDCLVTQDLVENLKAPFDKGLVREYQVNAIARAMKDFQSRFEEKVSLCEKRKEAFEKKIGQISPVRDDKKHIVNLHVVHYDNFSFAYGADVPMFNTGASTTPLQACWHSAGESRSSHAENFLSQSASETYRKVLEAEDLPAIKPIEKRHMVQESRKGKMSRDQESMREQQDNDKAGPWKGKWHRIPIKLSLDDKRALCAKSGIFGKKFKNDPLIIRERERTRFAFNLDIDTKDISDFIAQKDDWLKPSKCQSCPILDSCMDLINRSLQDAGYDPACLNFIQKFSQTKMGAYLSFVNLLSEELNLAKNHFGSHQFILSRIPRTQVLLLVKPTQAQSKFFYSLAFPPGSCEILPEGIFRNCEITSDGWTLTHFTSVDRHKIGNYLHSFEKIAALKAMFEEVWRGECDDTNETLMFSFLMHMEDKPGTSEVSLLTRYAYMEETRDELVENDPLKILTKLPEYMRSRLQIWIVKRWLDEFPKMRGRITDNIPDADVEGEDISGDSFTGIRNWVTGRPLERFEQCLELSYLGYLHNKDEGDQVHGYWKIFSKIIKLELFLTTSGQPGGIDLDFTGYKESPSRVFKSHEFSPMMCRFGARLIREKIQKGLSVDYNTWIWDRVSYTARTKTVEEFATMKAQAVIGNTAYDPYIDDRVKINKRRRVLEGVVEFITEQIVGNKPLFDFEKLIKKLENKCPGKTTGLYINLFKKNQFGGVREIFVMEMVDRFCVNFLEEVSVVIAEEVPGEMLTKGTEKLARTVAHDIMVREKMAKMGENAGSITVVDSADAATWCQRFIMPVFASVLKELLPETLFMCVTRVLNGLARKRLELPKALLDQFVDPAKANLVREDENMNILKDEFLGRREPFLLETHHSRMLRNRSNMGQGIPHRTSSLVGVAAAMAAHKTQSLLFKQWLDAKMLPAGTKLIMTSKNGSDDSSQRRSIIIPDAHDKKSALAARLFVNACAYVRVETLGAFCIEESIKSTINSTMLEEFNSVWIIKNTLLVPKIKFVLSSCRITPSTRIDKRALNMSELRKQVLESGGSFQLCAIIQILQASVHYSALGCNTNPLWLYYKGLLDSVQHPAFGFFPFEPSNACGLMGNQFSEYINSLSPSGSQAYASIMKREGVDVDEDGKPTISTHLLFGKGAKAQAFSRWAAERFPNVRTDLAENPLPMIRGSRNSEESLLLIGLKATDPSVSQSFSFTGPAQMMQASVYLFSTPCIIVRKRQGEGEPYKTSMAKLLYRFSQREKNFLTEPLREIMFPLCDMYEKLHALCNQNLALQPDKFVCNRALRKCELLLPKGSTAGFLSLGKIIEMIWFGKSRESYMSAEAEVGFQHYERIIPWLRYTYEESWEGCKDLFRDKVSMINYLKSFTSKSGTHIAVAPVNPNLSYEEMIKKLLCKNYSRVLTYPEYQKAVGFFLNRGHELMNKTMMLLESPLQRVERRVWDMLVKEDTVIPAREGQIIQSEFARYPMETRKLCLIQLACKAQLNSAEIFRSVAYLKSGIVGYWVIEQLQTESGWAGPGVWAGYLDGNRVNMHVQDRTVTKVVCEDISRLHRSVETLSSLLQSFQLTVEQGNLHKFELRRDGVICSNKGLGSEIIEKSPLPNVGFEDTSTSFEISCGDETITLLGHASGRTFKVVVCKPSTYVPTLVSTRLDNGPQYLKDWLSNSSLSCLPTGGAKELLANLKLEAQRAEEAKARGDPENHFLRNWCQASLSARHGSFFDERAIRTDVAKNKIEEVAPDEAAIAELFSIDALLQRSSEGLKSQMQKIMEDIGQDSDDEEEPEDLFADLIAKPEETHDKREDSSKDYMSVTYRPDIERAKKLQETMKESSTSIISKNHGGKLSAMHCFWDQVYYLVRSCSSRSFWPDVWKGQQTVAPTPLNQEASLACSIVTEVFELRKKGFKEVLPF